MEHKIDVVIGTGFGDEGKGITTDYLATPNSVVVRFSGGHQAGHNVRKEDKIHTFSNYGAGTFKGADTFWSKYCTVHPSAVVAEHKALKEIGVFDEAKKPKLFIDGECPVTTHYDIIYNRYLEKSRNPHGSCGVGFGQTIQRQEDHFKMHARDLLVPFIWKEKLKLIAKYYQNKFILLPSAIYDEIKRIDLDEADKHFERTVKEFVDLTKIIDESMFFKLAKENRKHYIFEGSQGILLDKDYGLFPHVTRSNTTSKNAIKIIKRNFDKKEYDGNVYYVTRAYHTRHGAGPIPNERLIGMKGENFDMDLFKKSEINSDESNQGVFKIMPIDETLVKYSMDCDFQFVKKNFSRNLVITCLDQIKGTYNQDQAVQKIIRPILATHHLENVYGSFSQDSKDFKKF